MKVTTIIKTLLFLGLGIIFIFFVVRTIQSILLFEDIQNEMTLEKKLDIPIEKKMGVYNLKLQKTDSILLGEQENFIHFWATWCKPCIAEFKTFDSILALKRNINVYFITEDKRDVVLDFIKNSNYKNIPFYTVNKDSNLFNIKYYPTTFHNLNRNTYEKVIGQSDWAHVFKQLD